MAGKQVTCVGICPFLAFASFSWRVFVGLLPTYCSCPCDECVHLSSNSIHITDVVRGACSRLSDSQKRVVPGIRGGAGYSQSVSLKRRSRGNPG